jgi:hypothetical protein
MADDHIQKEYSEYVERFCDNFMQGIEIADKSNNTKTGFVFLFIREESADCIDIASNLSSDSIKNVLEMALSNTDDQIEKQLGEFVPNEN